jgi:hypothetical protein
LPLYNLENTQAVVWETVPGVAFLEVADGSVKFHQTLAGHYRVVSRHSLRTTVQTLDQVPYSLCS